MFTTKFNASDVIRIIIIEIGKNIGIQKSAGKVRKNIFFFVISLLYFLLLVVIQFILRHELYKYALCI